MTSQSHSHLFFILPRNLLQHLGRDVIDFQLRLGSTFSKSFSRSGTSSNNDEDEDDDDIDRSGPVLLLSQKVAPPRAFSPTNEVISRNKVKQSSSDPTISRQVSSISPLPFTTYIPSTNKKNENDPQLKPLSEEEARIIECARTGDLSSLSHLIESVVVKGKLQSSVSIESLRDEHHMNPLDHASACGQVEVIRELILSHGLNVNCADHKYGYTPLHHACRAGQMQAVTFLVLVASADTNRKSFEGSLPADVTSSKRIKKS